MKLFQEDKAAGKRKADQALVARKAELLAECGQLAAQRAEVAVEVKSGRWTELALQPFDQRIAEIGHALGRISDANLRLRDSCPDHTLLRDARRLRAGKARICSLIAALAMRLDESRDTERLLVIQLANAAPYIAQSASVAKEHDFATRKYEELKAEAVELEQELAATLADQARETQELADLYEKMAAA